MEGSDHQANTHKISLSNICAKVSKSSKVAVQVMSMIDTDKIICYLKMVLAKGHHTTFTGGIKFLVMREWQK
ncbi:hypothetical protein [Mucilaginibacter paludis]|uniref:hypothetical protein n=1 Tax=Mucilaginibacter paludis TaxID=423351 RepID=UPI00145CC8A3|nr:hypothetical protein [Mucilaginibacter paludis]